MAIATTAYFWFLVYYVYRTSVLKKGVRYFVSAIIMRNNEWYEKEGRKKLGFHTKSGSQQRVRLLGTGSECTVTTADDLILTAEVFDQCAKTWVICLHGYRSDGQADCQEAAENSGLLVTMF